MSSEELLAALLPCLALSALAAARVGESVKCKTIGELMTDEVLRFTFSTLLSLGWLAFGYCVVAALLLAGIAAICASGLRERRTAVGLACIGDVMALPERAGRLPVASVALSHATPDSREL